MKKEFKLTNFAVDNTKTIYAFVVALIIAGVMAYQSTPKEKFPEITFPYYSVTTIYPGTSPADMENLVTRQLEKEIKGINGIKSVSSKSLQDFSLVFVEFETNVKDDDAYKDMIEAIDKAKPNLPAGILDDPEVTAIDLSEIPVLNINLSGDMGLVKMKEYADELQDRIESLEEVTRVDIVGALEREIQVNVDLYKMQAAGVNFSMIQQAIASENLTMSGGLLRTDGMNRSLRIAGEFKNMRDIQNILLMPGVYLKDIADVKDGFKERESYARLEGKDVITLNVIKKSGKNLIEAIDKIKVILEDFEQTAPESLIITPTGDQSTMTRNNVSDLFNTIIFGFIIVVLVLMFFMGIENALFVAVAIPLSMIISFIFIPAVGFTMNMVVLMAYILVLGIVVDNSIVVVENIHRHFMNTPNLTIRDASKRAVGEVALPVFAGTLTTMAPFVPLAFWQGIIGKFMLYIPITIIITLTVSMLVAYTMNPVFAVSFMKYRPKDQKKPVNHKKVLMVSAIIGVFAVLFHLAGWPIMGNLAVFGVVLYVLIIYLIGSAIDLFQEKVLPKMMNAYGKTITFLLKGARPYLVIFGTVALLFFTFFMMSIRTPKVVFFPEADPNQVFVYITMPSGTDIDVTDSITKVVEKRVVEVVGSENPDVDYIISNVAINAGRDMFERMTNPRLGKVTIGFVEYKFRKGPSTFTYLEQLRAELKGIPGAEIIVEKEESGPPTGAPVNIEISGEDIIGLIEVQEKLMAYIDNLKIQGIEELKSDMELGKPEITLNIDRQKALKMGISTGYIGMTMRTALYGTEVSTFREGDEEYDIVVRLDEEQRHDLETLMGMTLIVPDQNGGHPYKIPISSVVDAHYTSTYGGIVRIDFDRTITLSSNVLAGYNANEIVTKLQKEMKHFEVPEGYQVKFTGEQEEQTETAQFLGMALLAALLLILIILIVQFNSYAKPLIIAVQIIFSFIGILLGFSVFGLDMSIMMTGMGIIAVAGIVVKNAIIMIDYTDILKNEGMKVKEAVIKAGATRLTPVILTAASTIMGLLPLAIGMNINFMTLFSSWDPQIYFGGDSAAFWNSLAWTIIFGLAFATFLTLVVVPAMYYISFKNDGNGTIKKMMDKIVKA